MTGQINRLIVTGANGAGKSHIAAQLQVLRPEMRLISFDAIKLTENWVQKPKLIVQADLSRQIIGDAWILEGGPNLLPLATGKADAVLWLDPPGWLRATRLFIRPWRNIGKTRSELPPNNPDWPLRQSYFALQSLRSTTRFRNAISRELAGIEKHKIWHCRTRAQVLEFVEIWKQ